MGREYFPRLYPDEQNTFLDGCSISDGTLNDRWMEYWSGESSLGEGTMYDHIMDALSGTAGTAMDKLKVWCTGEGTFADVWYAKMVAGCSGEDGLLLEDGFDILLETGDRALKE